MIRRRVLVADDDESLRRVTQVQLEQAGYEIRTAADGAEALAILQSSPQDLIVTDLRMPGMSGLDLLRTVRREYPETAVVLMTAFGTVETAVDGMKAGAYDYVTKPVHADELEMIIRRALDHAELQRENRNLRRHFKDKFGFENIVGHSKPLLYVLDLAARAAHTDATVLIHGETGTGKELLAMALHTQSARRQKPFVTINCGAIPKDLLESELFGHVKGSFTGAMTHKKGKVETASGGTLFLDEIGETPLELQVKLLRLIQYGEIEKVGAAGTEKVDVRIIAATHRNLQAMIEDGTFREDLYYRLSVIPLDLPPLREHIEDVADLVRHFFTRARQKHGCEQLLMADSLMPYFTNYRWPGNIRELENIVERLVVLADSNEISVSDLPEHLRRQHPPVDALSLSMPPQGISLESVEKELMLRALQRFNFNQTQAAKYLDISRKALIYRMERHGIQRPETSLPDLESVEKSII